MKIRTEFMIIGISVLLLYVVCLSIWGEKSGQEIVSKSLNIDISNAEEISNTDSHGGFHGDGTTYIVLKFSDDKLLEQLKENQQWSSFPLDKTIKTLVYGFSDSNSSIGPFLGNDVQLPEIKNGYYRLIDRHSEKEIDILKRVSFNFTLAIYDTDTKTLHFYKQDT